MTLTHSHLRAAPQGPPDVLLVSRAPTMNRALSLATNVAKSDTTVLLLGETGTGKEVLARQIHDASRRAGRPYLALNCGALPPQLIESELFGHERGAFSGATDRRPGYFEAARGGTLVLDEVSELPLSLQTRLLRVLQEREVVRVGTSQPIDVDVRVVATSNRDLRQMVIDGTFRKDLYYRLNVFPLLIPPLRDRMADLPELVATLLARLVRNRRRSLPAIDESAFAALRTHRWPGNVRELANVLERALVLANDMTIKAEHIVLDAPAGLFDVAPTGASSAPDTGSLKDLERETIISVLQDCGGNRTHASQRLGISVRTLRNKLRDYRTGGVVVPGPPTWHSNASRGSSDV